MNNYANESRSMSWVTALFLAGAIAGCGGGGGGGSEAPSAAATAAAAAAAAAATAAAATATASANVTAAATAAGRTLTVGIGAGTGVGGNGLGPAPVNMLSISTNNFAILSKTGITNTGSHLTSITGNIGSSPITAAAMDNVFCTEIVGTIFGVDAAYTGSGAVTCFAGGPPPNANKTLVDNAILDVGTAFADAASRAPDHVALGAGAIGGMTLPPAVYKWATGVSILSDVFLVGGPNDVWIFQISGDITMASAKNVTLLGGALPRNIFWQVDGPTGVALGTTAHFEGTILASKAITVNTGASSNGRFLSQTAVTLDANTVVRP